MQDLPLQVAALDHVVIDQAQVAHASGSQVERRRRTQAAGTGQQHARGFQPALPVHADLGQAQVARVALQEIRFVRIQRGAHQRQPLLRPTHGPTHDRAHVAITGSTQDFGRGQRSPAELADQQDFGIPVGQVAAGIGLQLGLGEGQRPLRLTGRPLMRQADVDQQRAVLLALARLARADRGSLHGRDYRPDPRAAAGPEAGVDALAGR